MISQYLRNAVPIACLIAAALVGGAALAQEERVEPLDAQSSAARQITLYNGSSFNGAYYSVRGPQAAINLPYRIRSARIPQGERWQLCSQTQFRNCQAYTGPVRNVLLTVASARPVRLIQPPIGSGQSLRGMASEYFPAPRENGQRVEVRAGTGNAAAERADRFCRRLGWVGSAYERLQTVNRRNYLADVLCVRSGA